MTVTAGSKLDRFKKKVEILSTLATLAGLLGGGIFALVEYGQKVDDDRVKASLAYVERASKPPISDSLKRFTALVRENDAVVAKMKTYQEFATFVAEITKSQTVQSDIDTLDDFFRSLEACSARNICDRQTARAFFAEDAKALFNFIQPYVKEVRARHPSYAKALEGFINEAGAVPMKELRFFGLRVSY